MKRLQVPVYAGLLVATLAAPSFAADLPRPSYKAPVYSAPAFSWSGYYVGINAGYGFGKSRWTDTTFGGTTGDFNVKGAVVGATLGYNIQTGVWVYGIEGDIGVSTIKGTDNTICGALGCETKNTWLGTARGRLGYSFDRWLPYLTAGAAFGDIKGSNGTGSVTKTQIGWTAGAGVEYAFLGSWSAKLEYLYADLGKATCSASSCGSDLEVKFKTNLVRVGVNYRF
jgi:outer membrane immunogenic protein